VLGVSGRFCRTDGGNDFADVQIVIFAAEHMGMNPVQGRHHSKNVTNATKGPQCGQSILRALTLPRKKL
jgi:hypothetical protein